MSVQHCKQLLILITFAAICSCGQRGQCQWEGREEQLAAVEKTFGNPADATRLSPQERIWIDRKKHRVIVDGYVALNEGQLEMFACPAFTKEHESVVALFAKSISVHAGLLAVGAETGKTAKWEPEYVAPTGSEIQISAYWKDDNGKAMEIDARKWVRDLSGKDKHLEPNWVFAGSGFWEDPDTKKKIYNAESGDLICVSNFSTAALDIPIKSSQANSNLIFVAYTANIPKPATPVRLVLQVVNPKQTKTVEGPDLIKSLDKKEEETKTESSSTKTEPSAAKATESPKVDSPSENKK